MWAVQVYRKINLFGESFLFKTAGMHSFKWHPIALTQKSVIDQSLFELTLDYNHGFMVQHHSFGWHISSKIELSQEIILIKLFNSFINPMLPSEVVNFYELLSN